MNTLLNWITQVATVVGFGLQTIPQRKGSVAAAALGIAGVVAVLIGVLSIAQGFRQVMTQSGDPGAALVFRSGSDSEMTSGLSQEEVRVIADAPGIARTPEGPLASAELFVIINLPKRSSGTDANVPFRGVEPAAFRVRENLRFLEGRAFEPGKNEIIAGRGASTQFSGLDLGARVRIGQADWTVVGIFSANGSIAESEIWTDARGLQAAYRRGTTYQSVWVRLTSPDAFEEFKDTLTADPRVQTKVLRQTEYFEEQSQLIYRLVSGLGVLIASMMALGAVFGALNTMYTAVASRTREIATLRALGFGTSPVVASILLESLIVAIAGGLGGGLSPLPPSTVTRLRPSTGRASARSRFPSRSPRR